MNFNNNHKVKFYQTFVLNFSRPNLSLTCESGRTLVLGDLRFFASITATLTMPHHIFAVRCFSKELLMLFATEDLVKILNK